MKSIFFIAFALLSCAPHYVSDPNASVVVTSQYENEDERIILLPGDTHNAQVECNKYDDVGCSLALYIAAERYMKKGAHLAEKGLYLSAHCEYLLALSRLAEAEIRIERAKTTNLIMFKRIQEMNLEAKVQARLKECEVDNNIIKKYLWRP